MMRKGIGLFASGVMCSIVAIAPIPFRRWAIVRCSASVGAIVLVAGGYAASKRAIALQQQIDEANAFQKRQQKLIQEAVQPVVVTEALEKEQELSALRKQDFKLDASDAFATVQIHKRPEWVKQQLESARSGDIEPDESKSEDELRSETEFDEPLAAQSKADSKAQLKKLIDEHEGGWIGQLMKKPILIYGDMGSFKSYFAAFLALARYYLHDHQIISITDPHFHQNCDESWKYLVQLGVKGYGSHQNYSAIGEQMNAMYERFAYRTLKDEPLTSIWDEVTNYSLYKECEQPAKMLLRKTMSDPRKANESPILIGHDNTLVALGGGDGFSKSRNRGLIQLELFSDSENSPLFKGKISGIKTPEGKFIDYQEISIQPEWIRSEWVFNLFANSGEAESKIIAIEPGVETKTEPVLDPESDAQKLERVIDSSTAWDYWLAETTPEELDKILEQRRNQKVSEVSEADASTHDLVHPEPIPDKEDTSIDGASLVAKHFPNTSEEALFEEIISYLDTSKNASDIIKYALKCTKDKNSNRSYTNVGIPVFVYLVRKYGPVSLIAHFTQFLEKYS